MICDFSICSSFHPHVVSEGGCRTIKLVVTAIFAALAVAMFVTAFALPMVQLLVPAIVCAIIAIGVGAHTTIHTSEAIVVSPPRTPHRLFRPIGSNRASSLPGGPSAPPESAPGSPYRPKGPNPGRTGGDHFRGRNFTAYPAAYGDGKDARVEAGPPQFPSLVLPNS